MQSSGRSRLALIGVGAACAVAGSVAVATGAIGDGGTIHGCYDTKSGALRVVDAGDACVGHKELAISWNQEGRRGPTGPAGADGERGPTGPAGADGEDGSRGPTGPAGADGEDGSRGPTGPAGADGEDGSRGPTGPAGERGPTGPAGAGIERAVVGPAGTLETGTALSAERSSDGSYKVRFDRDLTGCAATVTPGYNVNNISAPIYSSSRVHWTALIFQSYVDVSFQHADSGSPTNTAFHLLLSCP